MNNLTQERIILRALDFGSVTPMDALRQAGCWRLGARIYDLRQKGYNIVTEYVTKKGKTYASYRLVRSHGTGCKK